VELDAGVTDEIVGAVVSYVTDSVLDAVLPLPAVSCALLAWICTDTVPAIGVTVNV